MAIYNLQGESIDEIGELLGGIPHSRVAIRVGEAVNTVTDEITKIAYMTIDADLTEEQIATLPIVG